MILQEINPTKCPNKPAPQRRKQPAEASTRLNQYFNDLFNDLFKHLLQKLFFVGNNSNLVFIIGFPRSGTTWMQNELSKIEGTFSPHNETFFLSKYFNRLFNAWKLDNEDRSVNGVCKIINETEFLEWMRDSCINLFQKMGWNGRDIFIEKTPYNIVFPKQIHQLFPEARVVLILRDPVEVYKSLLRISKLDWGKWAKKYMEIDDYCNQWNERFRNIQLFRELFDEKFYVVNYNTLKENPDGISQLSKDIFGEKCTIKQSIGPGGINLLSQVDFQSPIEIELETDVEQIIKERCYGRYIRTLNL